MELELVILPRAQKDLARLPHSDRERIKTRIEAYAATPRDQRPDVVPLVGTRSTAGWGLAGDFAIVEGRMEVTRAIHCREAYR